MANNELKEQLLQAESLDDVKRVLKDEPDDFADRVCKEFETHRLGDSRKLDADELDAVSGGADRDWTKDGCAATCEPNSWWAATTTASIGTSPTPISGPRVPMEVRISGTMVPVMST